MAAPAGGCGATTAQGYCNGSTLVWCEGGAIKEYNCANAGMSCGWQNESVGYNCL